ncbi:NmrA family NAD(P)-binding protein [Herpetosiphon sp.]|uniref:NmrA family protein n=1 Tax=Herpetosiphon aurantiacus (strain ATCC 23779 / DSM 785 / 114-95) TaxID=316274 RepID=A9AUD6_HERA2|nr:NmrA family NAD(P)-binding protein [Herpetosiphon sp.]ABX03055.1 NmrA family protein [Herpetosiphon aurantiacus DSM 785]
MANTQGLVAITGAAGQLGRLVLQQVLEKVAANQVVAITRDPAKLADVAAQGVKVVAGDFSDPAGLTAALAGVERVLMISIDVVGGERVRLQTDAVKAIAAAGVKHLVYTSAINPAEAPMEFIREHAATEQAIVASGLSYSFLRNNFYFETITDKIKGALAGGVIAAAAGDAAAGLVARADCAAAAAAALVSDNTASEVYNITGPVSLTHKAIAETVAEFAGREVAYYPIDAASAQQQLEQFGLPAQIAGFVVAIDHDLIGSGALDLVTNDVERLTGKPAQSLAEYLNANRELFS